MWRSLQNVFWLAKEVRSFLSDYVLLVLVTYSFTLAIISQAQSTAQEVHNAAIAIADEDHSQLSQAIAQAFLPPHFKPAHLRRGGGIDSRRENRLSEISRNFRMGCAWTGGGTPMACRRNRPRDSRRGDRRCLPERQPAVRCDCASGPAQGRPATIRARNRLARW